MLEYSLEVLKGTILTLQVFFLSLIISVLLGLITAFLKLSKNKIFKLFAQTYTIVIRGVPDLVLMLLIFYGGQILLNYFTDALTLDFIEISPFLAGSFTIGFIFGAYMAETFRGAILAIDDGQLEAAYAYGFSHWHVFYKIIIPQMIYHGLSSFTNNWLVMIKSISLVSIIGLKDMVYIANNASATTRQPFYFFLLVSIIFLIFTSLSLKLLNMVKNRYHFE